MVCFCLNPFTRKGSWSLIFFQDYFKTNKMTGSGDCVSTFYERHRESLKIIANKDHKITPYIFVYLNDLLHQVSQHQTRTKNK